ncbi:protein phosphatase 1 regulatory subunit 32 isoform X3 [Aquila chrysaetos chrysaetos]|uniref:protein phosphatase 1 regulatory subunit 32 isoform X3 n=1 Tax=Aquila chrysaetos chrysaetos TaxID=223781 RepID=UPI001B7D4809|nr:protein phosphatase 1 regulatory subunit 32 isoform X3 [Aquila chrysaetos chrysaetos]
MTKPPLPAVTQASHVSVPALATTPAAATCPTTTRPSPACSARAVQQRATARTPPRPPPLSTSSPFGSLTAGSCCPGMSTSRRAGTSKSPPFPAPTPGGVSPQHTWLLQGPPRASREHGTESRRASPAQPGSVRRLGWGQGQWGSLPAPSAPRRCLAEDDHRCQGAVGLHQGHPEERQHPASPASPARETLPHRVPCPPPAPQPLCTPRDNFALPQLGVSITTTDYLPSVRSHGGETLLALPACSERGNGFSREVPGCLGTAEPLGFTINHGQYVTPHPTPSPTVPAWCWQGPTWMVRPMGGIQPQRPSGFSTNNHPTGLGDITGHLPVWPPRECQPQR